MSLQIKGMDMPGFCIDCPCGHVDNSGVGYSNGRLICNGQYSCPNYDTQTVQNDVKDCPLSEIPTPHGRLIDADELITSIEAMKAIESAMPAHTQQQIFDLIINLLSSAGTVIEAEEQA